MSIFGVFPSPTMTSISFLNKTYARFHSQMVLNMLIKQKIIGSVCRRNEIVMVGEILAQRSLIKYKVKWKKKPTLIQIKTCSLLEVITGKKKATTADSIY